MNRNKQYFWMKKKKSGSIIGTNWISRQCLLTLMRINEGKGKTVHECLLNCFSNQKNKSAILLILGKKRGINNCIRKLD